MSLDAASGHTTQEIIIGVISDTHGLLRPEAVSALKGVSQIIHAGDVDSPEILQALKTIAPVHVVRGNMDRGPWVHELPASLVVEVGECLLYVLHDLTHLDLNPADAGFHAVIYGHTHMPAIRERSGVLFLNPGSAGHGRNGTSESVALLRVRGLALNPELVRLGTHAHA